MSGATAMGCGGSTAATTTTSAPAYTGSALSWLSAKARPFNKALNDDQAVVDVASAATSEIDPTTYFGRLASACTRLANDARRAGEVQAAPTAALAAAWRSDCILHPIGFSVHTAGYRRATRPGMSSLLRRPRWPRPGGR